MAQLNDCKFLALRDLGYAGAIDDMEKAWGADNGLPEGTVGVPWYNALINAGVTPSHINDMEASFWCDGDIGPVLNASLFFALTTGLSGVVDDVPVSGTFARAAGASSVEDFEGVVHNCKDGEARFWGARRLENLNSAASSDSILDWGTSGTATIIDDTTADLTGTANFAQLVLASPSMPEVYPSGTSVILQFNLLAVLADSIVVLVQDGVATSSITLTSASPVGIYEIQHVIDPGTTGVITVRVQNRVERLTRVQFTAVMIEKSTGTMTAASEYVESHLDHGANVTGVKYFNTDRLGSTLATLKGIMVEDADPAFDPAAGVMGTSVAESLFVPHPLSMQGVLGTTRMRCVWQRPDVVTTGADQYVMDAIGSVGGNQIAMTHAETTQNALAFAFSGGNPSATELDVDLSIPAVNLMYVEFDITNGLTLSLNGTTSNTAMPTPPDLTGGTLMGVGCRASDGGNTINGSIKNIAVVSGT